jgi:hypothetical protein
VNDLQKWNMSGIEASIAAAVPGIKVLGDSGYTYAPCTVVVRCVPGEPFAPGNVFYDYNKTLPTSREPAEWGCVRGCNLLYLLLCMLTCCFLNKLFSFACATTIYRLMHVSMGFEFLNKRDAMKNNVPVSAMHVRQTRVGNLCTFFA